MKVRGIHRDKGRQEDKYMEWKVREGGKDIGWEVCGGIGLKKEKCRG